MHAIVKYFDGTERVIEDIRTIEHGYICGVYSNDEYLEFCNGSDRETIKLDDCKEIYIRK